MFPKLSAVFLLTVVSTVRGGVLYHRQHGEQALPQQNYLDDGVRLVKITRTVAVPVQLGHVPLGHVPYGQEVPIGHVPYGQEVPLVLASGHQLVSVVPRLALVPQHLVQQHQQGLLQYQRQPPKVEPKPAFSRQQHEQFHYSKQQES